MSYLERVRPTTEDGPELVMVDDSLFSSRWPALLEFLTRTSWSETEPRETGTVTLFVEGSRLKLCLSDRDSDMVAFVAGDGPADALDTAEAALRENRLDWRASKVRRR